MVAVKAKVGVLGCTHKYLRIRSGTTLADIQGSVQITDWSLVGQDSTRYLAVVGDEVKVGAL